MNVLYTEDFITSKKYGKLNPIKECDPKKIGKQKRKTRYFLCKCDCGKFKEVSFSHLNSGKTKSCGCSKTNKHFIKHGLTNHKLYGVWSSMKQRCYDENKDRYKDWGGRGIKVCSIWKIDFLSFYNWAVNNGYYDGLQIDRIDNNGNYSPKNCHFVTAKENAKNRRKRSDTK